MVGRPVRMVKVAEGHDGERKKREDCSKNRGVGWFFLIFGPELLLAPNMKSAPIYRRWKRAILSSRGKNVQPLI